MRRLVLVPLLLVTAALPIYAQCGGCPSAQGCGKAVSFSDPFSVTLKTLAGEEYDLGAMVGSAPVVLLKLGTDAVSDTAAELAAAAAAENEDVVFLATLCDTGVRARKHLKAMKLTMPVLLCPNRDAGFCDPEQLAPAARFIAANGRVVLDASVISGEIVGQGLEAISAAAPAQDPVCEMSVEKSSAAAMSEYQGTTYYFCSDICRKLFDKNPGAYTGE